MADKALRGLGLLGRKKFARGGGSAPFLRGRSGSSNIKAPRGEQGWKQMKEAEAKIGKADTKKTDTGLHKGSVRKATSPKVMGTQRPKTKSDFWLKQSVKKIQKMPDKTFKYNNPGTRTYTNPRTGRKETTQKTDYVKGSIGKKKYIQDWKGYHHASQPKVKK